MSSKRVTKLCRALSSHSAQVAAAGSSPAYAKPAPNLSTTPFDAVSRELAGIRESILSLVGSKHPGLDKLARYYFSQKGQAASKQIRPMIVLLMSRATNGLSPSWTALQTTSKHDSDSNMTSNSILKDANPSFGVLSNSIIDSRDANILGTQRRLAEITEMIHVASLLHDDVIDEAETRRQQPSSPFVFGNKLSILGGDFLLARASLYLSRLGNLEVVELVASILSNLVEGEVMQLQPVSTTSKQASAKWNEEIFNNYMEKTYLKTASLISKTARSAVILGGCGIGQGWPQGEEIKEAAYAYGRHLGIAFQLVDDMLDYTSSAEVMGKPAEGADLKLGLATAPTLFAWQELPELGPLIERKFSQPGDVEEARALVHKSNGMQRTRELAQEHIAAAMNALRILPESESRTALELLTQRVLDRQK